MRYNKSSGDVKDGAMFKKLKQHIRILKKIAILKLKKTAFTPGTDEYIEANARYEHLRNRYFPKIKTKDEKNETEEKAKSNKFKKFQKWKQKGWGFVLYQMGMGIASFLIRRPIQIVAFYLLTLAGVKITEHKTPHAPIDPIELQTIRDELSLIKEQIEELKTCKVQHNNTSCVNSSLNQENREADQTDEIISCQDIKKDPAVYEKQDKSLQHNSNDDNLECQEGQSLIKLKSKSSGLTRIDSNHFVFDFTRYKVR